MTHEIRTIEEHELRSVWPHEEYDFTKWLMENIDHLTAKLGIEVEDVSHEEAIGSFSADIVGTEMNTGRPVVIENQYQTTDHDHLGKLLTYSAGKDAGFTIWVAENFRPEHKSVLEWLNESGPKDVRFFGIKPRVISIDGTEAKGFEFEIIVEPNDWERELTGELQSTLYNDIAELTEIGAVEVVSDTQPQRYRAVSLEAESKVVEELNEEYAIVNPPLIGLVGQAYLDENVAMFIDEHGYDLLWEVLHAYRRHLTGEGEYHYTELMAPIPNSQLESIVPALRYTLHQTTRDPLWSEDWSEELNASK